MALPEQSPPLEIVAPSKPVLGMQSFFDHTGIHNVEVSDIARYTDKSPQTARPGLGLREWAVKPSILQVFLKESSFLPSAKVPLARHGKAFGKTKKK